MFAYPVWGATPNAHLSAQFGDAFPSAVGCVYEYSKANIQKCFTSHYKTHYGNVFRRINDIESVPFGPRITLEDPGACVFDARGAPGQQPVHRESKPHAPGKHL